MRKVLSTALLVVLAAFVAIPMGQSAGKDPAEQASVGSMPQDCARATFRDSRVVTFLKVVKDDFGGTCAVPDPSKTLARARYVGSGDFSSAFFTVDIKCSGSVAAIHITTEFSPPRGTPLNLTLALDMPR